MSGHADDQRPLTEEGIKRMRRALRGLRRILETPDRLFSSPLRRARQTADLLHEVYPDLSVEEHAHLRPEDAPETTLGWLISLLAAHPNLQRIVLVGHEPHLSALLALLTLGDAECGSLPLKKGGIAILNLNGLHPGGAELLALLPPRVLRALG
jgi:phosphohistidine phosphatase